MNQGRRAFLKAAAAALASGSMLLTAGIAGAAGDKLKIGVIGSGRIGSTLGGLWVKAGHEVMFSSLDLEHDKALAAKLGGGARAGTPREAAAFGEVLLLAVPYTAVPAIGKDLAKEIKGKVLIDASNPIVRRDGEIAEWARQKGAGTASMELLPGARIVRTFNAIGYARMAVAHQSAERIGMPMAGDDPKAVAVASRLVREIGYEPVLVGGLADMGKHLIPGTPLAGERSPADVKQVASTLK
jgi:predicted dinucleotide-binding enzyme